MSYESAGSNSGHASQDTNKHFTYDELLTVLHESSIHYQLVWSQVARTDPSDPGDTLPLDPMAVLEIDADGTRILAHSTPPPELDALFARAGEALQRKDMDRAFKLYEEAVIADPSYFKGHTYLGNMYFYRKDYGAATYHLEKAVELNPLDYQAYFYLADTYYATNRTEDALNAITQAFMLNRNNVHIKKLLRAILDSRGMYLPEGHFVIPGTVEKMSAERVVIRLEDMSNEEWSRFLTCLAAWRMDPVFASRRSDNELAWLPTMYSECIRAHTRYVSDKLQLGKKVSSLGRLMLRATIDGYLHEMVYWEFMGARNPGLIAGQPKEIRASLVRYIRNYVYQR